MKTDQQLRQEISNARKLLRERRKQRWGTATKRGSYFRGEHEYLETAREMTLRRMEIFRNAGGEVIWFDQSDPSTIEEIKPATCDGCVEPHLVSWNEGEWNHNVKSKGGRRCDCAKCGQFVCKPYHVRYHNRVIATRPVER